MPLTPTPTPGQTGPAVAAVRPTPKKDTVRIEVPNAKQIPQATVKLQQTQPMVRPPAAEVRTLAAPALVTVPDEAGEATEDDGLLRMASIGVFVLALLTFASQLWTFIASK